MHDRLDEGFDEMNQRLFVALMAAITTIAWPIFDAHAQQSPPREPEQQDRQADKSADQVFDDAVAAFEAKRYQRALDLLELASFKEEQPRFVYQRILVLEAMQQPERALATLDEHRKALAGQPGVGDLTALEQRLREEASPTSVDNLTSGARADRPERSDYIAWTLIGSGTLAAGGGVAFLLLAESEVTEVRCSGMYPESQRQDCAGVDAPAYLSRTEFDQRLERADSYRIAGGSLLTLGVLAAGYGGYRWLSTEGPAAAGLEEDTVVFEAAPRWDGGMEAQVIWRF